MSSKHPIVAVTGSSGAGTTTVKNAFNDIFRREDLTPAVIEGDSFHAYERSEMKEKMAQAEKNGENFSHFGPEANHFDKLEELFKTYSETGSGQRRFYIHSEEEAEEHNARLGIDKQPGQFTPWEDLPQSDLLFYEGLHGGVADPEAGVDVAQWTDLLVGVVPAVNLEWIQKISRDTAERGYSASAVTDTILRRMHDYVHYITPQFSRTHINFQRVPLVDTSNPFIARDIPTPDESMVVIHFNAYKDQDWTYLMSMIQGSFMSRPNTLVVPGPKMGFAMELILNPIIHELVGKKTG
jgi:phosphoribulokinase